MGGGRWSFENIPDLVESGKLDESVVDTAVSRVLRAKFKQGLFEHPFTGVPDDKIYDYIHTDEHVALAQKLDEESIVLLENHDDVLPLKKDANVAVIGPMGHGYTNVSSPSLRAPEVGYLSQEKDQLKRLLLSGNVEYPANIRIQYGDYVIEGSMWNDVGVTPFKGIEKISEGTVTFTQGCERWSNDDSGFPEAVAAAEAADVAVVVVGTWSRDQTELWQGLNATTGESVDVSNLNLVGAMPRLVQAIIDTGVPTVVVFSSGKPITEPWIGKEAAALVQHFYQSEAGGHALARVLYGDVNPSGKLSVSFPYDVGTLPIYYDHANSARGVSNPGTAHSNGTLDFGRSYILQTPLAQYTFGYGLSYSTFEFSDLSVSSSSPSADDTITVSVDVTNTSDRKGGEVVQLYVKDVVATVEVPRYTLKGFKKVFVEAGETETVEIELDVGEWGVYNRKMDYVVEPGEFVILAGTSSEDFFGNVTVTVS